MTPETGGSYCLQVIVRVGLNVQSPSLQLRDHVMATFIFCRSGMTSALVNGSRDRRGQIRDVGLQLIQVIGQVLKMFVVCEPCDNRIAR